MSYETELNIALKVTDGPAIQAQKTKSPKEYWNPEYKCSSKITEVQSKRIVLDPQKLCETIEFPSLSTTKQLGFVAVSADKMWFKDTCGRDQPGIYLYKNDCEATKDVLDGPQIYVNRQVQLLEICKLTFAVCKEMFACIKEPEKQKVTITVTFGIAEHFTPCEPCDVSTNGQQQSDEYCKTGNARSRKSAQAFA